MTKYLIAGSAGLLAVFCGFGVDAFAVEAADLLPPVVPVAWLADEIDAPDLVVLHVGPRGSYETAHIPGSRPISLRGLLEVTPAGLRDEMPPLDKLAGAFAAAGVGEESRVVIYASDPQALPYAARVLVTLEYLGRAGMVAVLDGGLADWRAAEHPIAKGDAPTGTAEFQPTAQGGVLVDAAWLAARLEDPAVAIIDGRPAESYAGHGAHQVGPRPGHVPGAASLPFFTLTDDDGRFKPEKELATMFADAGGGPDKTNVVYCGTGIWACTVYLAGRILDYEVRLYDGSFQEWSGDEQYAVVGPVDPKSIDR